MKNNAKKIDNNTKSSIGKKIIFNIFVLVLVVCISIISNNNISEAKDNEDKPVKVDSSTVIKNNPIHSTDNVLKAGTLEYSIKSADNQKDKKNPILGKDSKYILVTMSVKNNGNTTEVYDAFDMKLEASINGEKKTIFNIAETTIYNISPGTQSDVKLIYIVPKNSSDLFIVSEKNSNIKLQIKVN